MATDSQQLEHRLSEIENELERLKSAVFQRDKLPWWRQIVGDFEGDEEYAEIVRLGQQLRRADGPESE